MTDTKKHKQKEENHKAHQAHHNKNTDEIEKLTKENLDLKDKLLRTLSDMENLRKRTQKEISDTASYSISKFAKEIISVSDNLKRALSSISENDREKDASLNNLFKGVSATEDQLMKSFENFHIKKINCEGIFNPEFHEVMLEQESDKETGTILNVLEEGFTIGERLLRPARVIVSK
jgi:molecular chaperone GrpE